MRPTHANDSGAERVGDVASGRRTTHVEPWRSTAPTRVVVLGGGVGGLAAARHLERPMARRSDVEVTLVSRDNFFLLSPLLFEACAGVLELRHCAQVVGRRAPKAFVYRTLGTMAAFGHSRAAADLRGLGLTGFPAWWMRRTY